MSLTIQSSSPYNKKNVLIKPEDISRMLSKYCKDIVIKDISLFREAMTEESYCIKHYTPEQIESWNKELIEAKATFDIVELQPRTYQIKEFLGDIIIKAIITEYITDRYDDPEKHNEGFLTTLKSRLEDTGAFAHYSRILGLGTYMLISRAIEENNGRDSEKLLEDTFEAFIGALYLDQGWDVSYKVIHKYLETEVDYAEILSNDNNYRKRLQDFYHENKWSHPKYETISEEKINGKNFYTACALTFDEQRIESTINTNSNLSSAKKEAARLALEHYSIL